MARKPRRRVQAQPAAARVVAGRRVDAEEHQQGRPLREGLRLLVRRGMARGGPALRALLLPLRLFWRAVARGGRAVSHLLRPLLWRGLAVGGHALQPAAAQLAEEGRPLRERLRSVRALLRPLRRAVVLGGPAVRALLRPLRLLLALGGRHLQSLIPRRALALGRRLFLARVGRQATVYGAGGGEPRTPPKPRAQGSAIFYDRRAADDRRRLRPPSPSPLPLPQPQPTAPPPVVVDGVDVPRHIVDLYVDYCMRTCTANSTVCHFCIFEMQRSKNLTVPTWQMPAHCHDFHRLEGGSVRCNEAGCSVRVRPGHDLALHRRFVHDFPLGWWHKYILCTQERLSALLAQLMEETSGVQRHPGVQMMEIQ